MLKISVIIPVYNAEKYIEKCIDSLLVQDVEMEIICVNDGSTDMSLSILERYKRKQKNFCLISYNNNKGQAYARNLGMQHARGEYICFVDADDMLRESSLKRIVEIMDDDNLDIFSFEAEVIYENQEIEIRYPYNLRRNILSHGVTTGENIFIESMKNNSWKFEAWRLVYSRSYLKKYDLKFDIEAELCEDIFFVFQAVLHAQRAIITDEIFYIYRRRKDSSMTSDNKLVSRFKGRFISYVQVLIWAGEKKISEQLSKYLEIYFDSEFNIIFMYWKKIFQSSKPMKEILFSNLLYGIIYDNIFLKKYKYINVSQLMNIGFLTVGKRIVIYGNGVVAKEMKKFLSDVEFDNYYVAISDTRKSNCADEIFSIDYFSTFSEDVFVIVAASGDNKVEMVENLRRLGLNNFCCVN